MSDTSEVDKNDLLRAKKSDKKTDIRVSKQDELVTSSPENEASKSNKRYQTLQKRKQSGIVRLDKARSHLEELISVYDFKKGSRSSKTSILRAIKKVRAEYTIIEEIITSIKTTIAVSDDELTDVDDVIDNLEQELNEIIKEVDCCIKRANDQLDERIFNGEKESEVLSDCASNSSSRTAFSKASSLTSSVKRRQQEWKEAHERLNKLEQEQLELEKEINQKTDMFELNQRRIEDARSITKLNEARAKASLEEEQKTKTDEKSPPPEGKIFQAINTPSQKTPVACSPQLKPVKLKGVTLPTFSGEDKTKFEPWYAAFCSVVDETDIPVKEKMLRLQGCLTGKALETVRDLGFSDNAYDRAKDKLKKKYGGKRRQTLTHLTTLRGLPKVRRHNLADMEDLLAVLDRILVALQDGDTDGEMRSQHLNLTVKEKLPEEDIRAYKYWLHEHGEDDSFEKLVQWIETRVQIMDEALEETGEFNKKRNDKRFNRGFNTTSNRRKCIVDKCREDHPPWVCAKFKELSVTQRKELIAKTGRCFRCLAAGHQSKNCPRNRKCGVNGCESSGHSSFLHDSSRYASSKGSKESQKLNGVQQAAGNAPPTEDKTKDANTTTYTASQVENVSLMILPANIMNGAKKLTVNVMLDPCSTGSYITESAAEELQLKGRMQNLTISGTAGIEVKKLSRRVELSVGNLNGNFCAKLEANVLNDITGNTPAIEWNDIKEQWPHLRHIPFAKIAKRRQVDVLIGSDHPIFHKVFGEVTGSGASDPVARQTNLGWVCYGPTTVSNLPCKSRSHHSTRTFRSANVDVQETNDLLRKFWDLESIGIKDGDDQDWTHDERTAVKTAEETRVFEDERYEIGIPWKKGEPKFENNFEMAYSRLENLEKSLINKGPKVSTEYNNVIEDYVDKNYIRKVPLKDEEQWLLPHFPVIKEDRATTKVRIVYDAAAKDKGKCLNDAILSGPKLQRDLVDVLMRFRRAPVALSADISEMFLQVKIRKEDQRYHRFLWRNFDQSRNPDVYEFQRLPFGNTASPFCAQYVLRSHARSQAAIYPEAADTVENSMYVDDVLDSRETTQEAKILQRELSGMLSAAGFALRKWLSNDVTVIKQIPNDDRLPGIEIPGGNLPMLKTLGVLWKPQEDVFTFQVKQPKTADAPTKRSVLSAIATLFDPLQLLSPFTVRAKMLMQEIWTAGLDWDDTLPDNLKAKWNVWISELPDLLKVYIPRCLRLPDPIEKQLHVFSDASKDAYAGVAYFLCKYNDKEPTCHLITSKSRVSPIKAVTIPRLELMGGVLAARLARNIRKTLAVDKTTFWTDSTNVLHWVRSQSRSFKPFIANRIGELQRITDPEQWRHIPGKENPADLPTRGLTASQLTASKVWMEGPEFLKSDEASWPDKLPNLNAMTDSADTERRKKQTHHTNGPDETMQKDKFLDPSRISSFTKLIRITAWMKRFVNNCRLSKESRKVNKSLRPHEITRAEQYWLRRTQTEAFPDGQKDKRLLHFSPKKDEEGLLRADGRLRFARELPYDTRHPILLPKDHPLTKLIIVDAHEKRGHGTGVEHLLTELRSKYWVIKGRRAVRNVVEACPGCRRRFTTKQPGQKMAPLPPVRVRLPLKAFDKVGVDYAGPFRTKQGRGKPRAKRYLCLFTCLTTRAVHLEMSYSLDTDSFLNAFTRMTSRRGMPSYVVSDNGGNFVSGEKELRELISDFDQEKIVNSTSRKKPIEWKFNPPSAPHFGGIFESMIKSSKKALRTILGDADVNDEELHTAICGAEHLLNSRPITYVSSDVNDLTPLTPSHFLVGQFGGDLAPEIPECEAVNPKKRWRRIQQLLGQFWRRWRREFLPSLNVRRKWFQKRENFKEGDVVLLIEPNAKRGEWPLARVVEAHPGKDGLVRVVKIQIGDSTYMRPVHHLCPLEVKNEED